MPGPLAIWAAKKALKSKTGQQVVASVKAKGMTAIRSGLQRGSSGLSQHQFPDSPPWGETQSSATDASNHDDDPPPW